MRNRLGSSLAKTLQEERGGACLWRVLVTRGHPEVQGALERERGAHNRHDGLREGGTIKGMRDMGTAEYLASSSLGLARLCHSAFAEICIPPAGLHVFACSTYHWSGRTMGHPHLFGRGRVRVTSSSVEAGAA